MFSFCFKASTNKFYFSRQCTYNVFITAVTQSLNFTQKAMCSTCDIFACISIWVSTARSLFEQCLLCFALHKTQCTGQETVNTSISKCIDCSITKFIGGRRGRDRMVVGFTTTYTISAYHHVCCDFESR